MRVPRESRDATCANPCPQGLPSGCTGSGAIAQWAVWWGAGSYRSVVRRREQVELLHLQRGQGLPAWVQSLGGCCSCGNRGWEGGPCEQLRASWQCQQKQIWKRHAGLKRDWFLAGKAHHMLLASGGYSKLIDMCAGVPLPVLEEFILQKSEGCGVGKDGCWWGWSMASMSPPDQLQPCHQCPVPRAGVHVMHLGQDLPMETALHMSQKLAGRTCCLAQCISDCWEKCLAPLFLTALWAETFRELITDFLPAGPGGRSGGICFLQGWVFLPLIYWGTFPVRPVRGLIFPIAAAADSLDVPTTARPAGWRAAVVC